MFKYISHMTADIVALLDWLLKYNTQTKDTVSDSKSLKLIGQKPDIVLIV